MSPGERVAVLLGGMSAEREVSLATGAAVAAALRSLGHDVVEVDVGPDLGPRLAELRPTVAFIALHGKLGEDGAVQGLLEVQRIPYTGSGVLASAVAMDKAVAKRLFEAEGIPTPPFVLHRPGDPRPAPPSGYPCVVKPATEGSSVGVSIVQAEADLDAALAEAHRFDDVVLVERYVDGREIQVAVLDGESLGTLEIVPEQRTFYDYETKYTDGMARHLVPAPLDEPMASEVVARAVRACALLGVEGGVRAEFLVDADDAWLLEVNTLPGMTGTSLLPEIAAAAGLDFEALVGRILAGARLRIPSVGRDGEALDRAPGGETS